MKNILIVCTGNSCRSQMAHGYLSYLLKNKAVVYSAGIETHGVNPYAIKAMADDGRDISGHTSNHVSEYTEIAFDYIITVCDHAKESCPYIPGSAKRFHHSFPDPACIAGSEENVMTGFHQVRDLIRNYCIAWVTEAGL